MLFTKGAGPAGLGGGSANKVAAAAATGGGNVNEDTKDGGKESKGDGGGGGIVIYNGDDDGGVGECDDEDLRLLESMGGGTKNKPSEGEKKPPSDAAVETRGKIHIDIRKVLLTPL